VQERVGDFEREEAEDLSGQRGAGCSGERVTSSETRIERRDTRHETRHTACERRSE
jgi:hypothetical protein